MSDPTPLDLEVAAIDDVAALRAEVARLRALVGPSEESYEKLRLDVLGARDVAIGAEAELGRARARIAALETDVARYRRDFVLVRRYLLQRVTRVIDVLRVARRAARSVAARVVRR